MIPATQLPPRTLRTAAVADAQRNPLILDQVTPSLAVLKAAWDDRRERLTLALIAVPLAETATGMTGQWWAWPALLAGAWACTRHWRWTWLLSLELGVVGVMWGMVGANGLAHTGSPLVVGAAWIAVPLALAVAGMRNRRHARRPEAYFPLR